MNEKYNKTCKCLNHVEHLFISFLLEEINHNDLMNEKYNKTCKCLNHVEHLFISASTVTGCV